jgi:hypothetical protein
MSTAAIKPLPARPAPFERPRGRRGLQGLAAAVSASAAVVALVVAHRHGTLSSSGGFSGYTYAWSTQFAHPTEAVVVWLSTAAFVVAATALWRARRRRLVAVALSAVIAATIGSAWGIANARDHASPSAARVNALPRGLSEAAVRKRLGEPAAVSAQATPRAGGAALPCLLYAIGGRHPSSVEPLPSGRLVAIAPGSAGALLCFTAGRLSVRVNTGGFGI